AGARRSGREYRRQPGRGGSRYFEGGAETQTPGSDAVVLLDRHQALPKCPGAGGAQNPKILEADLAGAGGSGKVSKQIAIGCFLKSRSGKRGIAITTISGRSAESVVLIGVPRFASGFQRKAELLAATLASCGPALPTFPSSPTAHGGYQCA